MVRKWKKFPGLCPIYYRRAYKDVPSARLCTASPACSMPSQLARGLHPLDPLAASQHVALAALNPNIQSHLISFISLIQYKSYHYNSSAVSISLYTTFTVLPPSTSFSNTFTLCPDVHLDNPTYNCPCEKKQIS